MNIQELKANRAAIEQQYNNLSDSKWIDAQREQLKGKYDILGEVISQLEREQDATSSTSTTKQTPSNSNKGK